MKNRCDRLNRSVGWPVISCRRAKRAKALLFVVRSQCSKSMEVIRRAMATTPTLTAVRPMDCAVRVRTIVSARVALIIGSYGGMRAMALWGRAGVADWHQKYRTSTQYAIRGRVLPTVVANGDYVVRDHWTVSASDVWTSVKDWHSDGNNANALQIQITYQSYARGPDNGWIKIFLSGYIFKLGERGYKVTSYTSH